MLKVRISGKRSLLVSWKITIETLFDIGFGAGVEGERKARFPQNVALEILFDCCAGTLPKSKLKLSDFKYLPTEHQILFLVPQDF